MGFCLLVCLSITLVFFCNKKKGTCGSDLSKFNPRFLKQKFVFFFVWCYFFFRFERSEILFSPQKKAFFFGFSSLCWSCRISSEQTGRNKYSLLCFLFLCFFFMSFECVLFCKNKRECVAISVGKVCTWGLKKWLWVCKFIY